MIGPPICPPKRLLSYRVFERRLSVGNLRLRHDRVLRVQIAVLEVLIQSAVESIRATLDRLVELTTRRVTELSRKLVLQNREVIDCIIRNLKQRTGNATCCCCPRLQR